MIEYTLRQLEVFTAATEQESLTRAADQLHLTQSTASTHLRSLEQCLGYDAAAAQRTGRRDPDGGRPKAISPG